MTEPRGCYDEDAQTIAKVWQTEVGSNGTLATLYRLIHCLNTLALIRK